MCLLMRMCLRRKSVKGLLFALLINSVDRDFKHRVFSAQLLAGVIIRESNFHTDLISRVAADELLFEIIDISAGADDEIRAVSIRAAAVKFDAVHCAHVVDIYGIAVLDSESGIGRKFGIVRGFAFCASACAASSLERCTVSKTMAKISAATAAHGIKYFRKTFTFRIRSRFWRSLARCCCASFLFSFFIVIRSPLLI